MSNVDFIEAARLCGFPPSALDRPELTELISTAALLAFHGGWQKHEGALAAVAICEAMRCCPGWWTVGEHVSPGAVASTMLKLFRFVSDAGKGEEPPTRLGEAAMNAAIELRYIDQSEMRIGASLEEGDFFRPVAVSSQIGIQLALDRAEELESMPPGKPLEGEALTVEPMIDEAAAMIGPPPEEWYQCNRLAIKAKQAVELLSFDASAISDKSKFMADIRGRAGEMLRSYSRGNSFVYHLEDVMRIAPMMKARATGKDRDLPEGPDVNIYTQIRQSKMPPPEKPKGKQSAGG